MSHLLTSWKEIAAYMGKGVRTVQRWERQLGLPVRRPAAPYTGTVIAVSEELDAWVLAWKVCAKPNSMSEVESLPLLLAAAQAEIRELKEALGQVQKTSVSVIHGPASPYQRMPKAG